MKQEPTSVKENASFEKWWKEVGDIFSYGDKIQYEVEDGDEIIIFYNSIGMRLSSYNLDRNTVTYY